MKENIQFEVDVQPITRSEILGLASWNRTRSDEELSAFVDAHLALLQ